jgi:O-antigen biosynthesis protein WbqP
MKRLVDLILTLIAALLLLFPGFMVSVLVKLTSKGPVLYWSDRVGKNNAIFKMPKFRSMKLDTPVVATHLLADPKSFLTPVGDFLRKSSLDEIPQLWCILKGDMSFVGPRPALFNQDYLITLRTDKGVHALVPGLTGWAQINGRDELPIPQKVGLDVEYLHCQSLWLDIKIIWLTFIKVIKKDGVSH